MNKVILMGRLTRNPEIFNSDNEEKIVGKYTLAVRRMIQREGEENVDYIGCTAFGSNAKFAESKNIEDSRQEKKLSSGIKVKKGKKKAKVIEDEKGFLQLEGEEEPLV